MYSCELQTSGKTGEAERRDPLRSGDRCLGRVVACNGSKATIAAVAEDGKTDLTELWSVGRLISILVGRNRVVAIVHSMSTGGEWSNGQDNTFHIEVELLGEVQVYTDGREVFSTGISSYPHLGAIAHRMRSTDLLRIYDSGKSGTCVMGKLSQDESIDAASYPDHAVVIDTDTLDLPFWLMRLDEFAEVTFRGRSPVPDEFDFLRDLIPEAKRAFPNAQSKIEALPE